MTDREMLREQLETVKDEFFKSATVKKLMGMTNVQTGMLSKGMYIPANHVEVKFLMELLGKLGYHCEYKEEYNSFFGQQCLIITLSKKS